MSIQSRTPSRRAESPLTPEQIAGLRTLYKREGELRALEITGCSRGALTRALAGQPVRRGTIALITIALAAPNRNVSTSTGELIITATLPQVSPANGSTLREVALMLGNGACFARQVHPDMAKSIAFTLTYIWNIAITA